MGWLSHSKFYKFIKVQVTIYRYGNLLKQYQTYNFATKINN